MHHNSYDILIVGGGTIGFALANMLAPTGLSIAVLEAQAAPPPPWSASDYHPRVSAITLASQKIFQALDVWESMREKRVQAFKKIQVWDGLSDGKIEFDGRDIARPILGHIIENNLIQCALKARLAKYPQLHLVSNVLLTKFTENEQGIALSSQDGDLFQAKIAVASDGANSWLRKQAGIEAIRKEYHQTAIVAMVETELPHQAIASQVFLETGPLAFLPLASPHTSSIVWSMPTEDAHKAMALAAIDFQQALAKAFAYRLGKILQIGQRYSFPLFKQQAKKYVQSKVVLVGDAAHVVHPMAGQGLNMGLLDAASLRDVIMAAIKTRGAYHGEGLRHYERWRKADNLALLHTIDAIRQLFAKQNPPTQALRSYGLKMTDRLSWLKNKFIHHAVGNRMDLPYLAQ